VVHLVASSPGEDEKDGVSQEGDAVLHAADHLLPHPLGDIYVANQDHHWTRDEPQGVEAEERIVESALR
jgi:hypothetical protein